VNGANIILFDGLTLRKGKDVTEITAGSISTGGISTGGLTVRKGGDSTEISAGSLTLTKNGKTKVFQP
jgi:hypothetical protein